MEEMKIELIEKVLKVPKELLDVEIALTELVKDIKEKKDIGLIVAENLFLLITAVEGYDKLDDEFKSEFGPNVIALMASDLVSALKKKPEVPVLPVGGLKA